MGHVDHPFQRLARYRFSAARHLFCCYHPSRYNLNTGRVSAEFFDAALRDAARKRKWLTLKALEQQTAETARQVLAGALENLGLLDQSSAVLRAIDKLPKIGREKVIAELVDSQVTTTDHAEKILTLADLAVGDIVEVDSTSKEGT